MGSAFMVLLQRREQGLPEPNEFSRPMSADTILDRKDLPENAKVVDEQFLGRRKGVVLIGASVSSQQSLMQPADGSKLASCPKRAGLKGRTSIARRVTS
jgi:hypothetical protein